MWFIIQTKKIVIQSHQCTSTDILSPVQIQQLQSLPLNCMRFTSSVRYLFGGQERRCAPSETGQVRNSYFLATGRSAIGRILSLFVVQIQGVDKMLAEVELYQTTWCAGSAAFVFDHRTFGVEFVYMQEIGPMLAICDHPTDANFMCYSMLEDNDI